MPGSGRPARDPSFGTLKETDLAHFRQLLGNDGVLTEPRRLESFNTDWMLKYRGQSQVALLPESTEQVSKVLRYCHDHWLAVVPQGGNTGLVGGSVPVFDEVVLSLKRMNKVISVDAAAGVAVAEAGVVLEDLEAALMQSGLTVPLDLGPRGKCQLGGNVSTNAGGLRLLRHGSLKGSVLGLEVVLANGTVLDALRTLRKDNTGYDLKQLFIGAEGTLGVVTKVALLAPQTMASTHVALFGCDSFAQCVTALQMTKTQLGEILSAFEFFDRASLELVLRQLKGTADPLPTPAAFYVVVETSGSVASHDREKLSSLKEALETSRVATAMVIGEDPEHAARLMALRERITVALKQVGAVYKYDLSLPTAGMYDLVEAMRQRLASFPGVAVVGFGHLGDGNLHLNISAPGYTDELLHAIEPFVYEYTSERRGSISAEHGLGCMKPEVMVGDKPAPALALMGGVKQLLDPHGILNPYKVLPARVTGQFRDVLSKL